MRLVVGSIMHETNTFSTVKTDLSSFQETELLFGLEILEHHSGRETEIGGILNVARKKKVELVLTLSACALPSGKVTNDTFQYLKDRLLKSVKETENINGILLVLHGAMVTDSIDDVEGNILKEVRNVVGEDIYIGVTLDLHANVTHSMVENADFLIGYRTHPHIDQHQNVEDLIKLFWSNSLFEISKVSLTGDVIVGYSCIGSVASSSIFIVEAGDKLCPGLKLIQIPTKVKRRNCC